MERDKGFGCFDFLTGKKLESKKKLKKKKNESRKEKRETSHCFNFHKDT